jgi:serine/threonine protein kinase
MLIYLRQLCSYAWLGKLLYSYQKMFEATSEHDCGYIETIVNQVIQCGAVPTKFCQWIIPNLELSHIDENDLFDLDYETPAWLKKLSVVFEGCPEHSLRFTYGEYRKQFDTGLQDDYQVLECIGSGSIGQVYKIRDIHTDQILVMKVRHPYIKEQICLFDHLYRILNWLLCTYMGVHHYLPFHIPSFIKGFREQSDFVQEANHLLKMRSLYQDNWTLRIPEIKKVSESIMVMEYVEGISFDRLGDISAYQKTKIFSVFYLFTREAMMIHNFNHGDLHLSNWKVLKADNPLGYQVVLYDFGYCWSAPDMGLVHRCIDFFEATDCDKNQNDISDIADLLFECVDHSHVSDKTTLYENLQTYLQESPHLGQSDIGIQVTPIVIYKVSSGFCIQESLFMKPLLIQFVILYTQIQKNCATCGFASITGLTERSRVYKDRYLQCLNFCKTYGIYPKYQRLVEDKLNELQVERTSPFDFVGIPESLASLALTVSDPKI